MKEHANYILNKRGFESLNDTQENVLSKGIEDSGNYLIVAPTGNGKTMCAEIKMRQVLKEGGNIAYLVPSKQLVRSKKEEIEEWCDKEVYDSSSGFRNGSVTVVTFESYNASVLNGTGYSKEADLVVLDDFHEIYSSYRGPGIEKTVSSLLYNNIPVFAMSASVGNPEDIADWMNAKLIVDDVGREIEIEENFIRPDKSSKVESVNSFIRENKEYLPGLVFNSRRSYCESRASNLKEKVDFSPEMDYRDVIKSKVNHDMTPKLENLADCMNNGIAFHHAGLPKSIKNMIEKEFEKQRIKVIYCTTTIAYGFDAPVKSIFVSDIKRYTGSRGMDYIGVWEYKQWIGRAGRPGKGFDDAYSFVFCQSPEETEAKFGGIPKDLEDIESHLELDGNFRWLLLELIYAGFNDPESIEDFFSKTLFSRQITGDTAWGNSSIDPMDILEDKLKDTSNFLENRNLVEHADIGNDVRTTDLGKAFAEFSLFTFDNYRIETLYKFYNWYSNQNDITENSLIRKISEVFDIKISFGRQSISQDFKNKIVNNDYKDDDHGKTTCMILEYWTQNKSLKEISEQTEIDATNLNTIARNISNTMNNMENIISLTSKGKIEDYDKINKKIKLGVSEENLNLVKAINNFGRYRLRKIEDLINNLSTYHEISGENLEEKLRKLKEEIGEEKLRNDLEETEGIGNKTSDRIISYINSSKN